MKKNVYTLNEKIMHWVGNAVSQKDCALNTQITTDCTEHLCYLHRTNEVIHPTVVDVDHGIVEMVFPAQKNYLQGKQSTM